MSLERNISSNNQKNSRKITLKVNSKAKKLAKPHSFYSEKLYYENVQDTKNYQRKKLKWITIKKRGLRMQEILT